MQLPEDHWYPVLDSRELGLQPLPSERLGQRLVFWRTADGSAHANLDRCPHLGAALSGGSIREGRLTCPFHGFQFDTEGRCRHIPAIGRQGRIPIGMAVRRCPLREAHGLIWLWWGEARETYPELPSFPQLQNAWRYGTVAVE
jgi:phenylpropionate dioxygenase-like ring-hydroxylating dioxygenase large terminal subunit